LSALLADDNITSSSTQSPFVISRVSDPPANDNTTGQLDTHGVHYIHFSVSMLKSGPDEDQFGPDAAAVASG